MDEEKAVELFNSDADRNSVFTSKVHVIDEDQEDPDIDMDLTIADLNRAFVSESALTVFALL